jgi:hypothetical protein
MTSQTTSIYTPFADGRPVRDIVEHTPALVNETWCRKLLAHTLDSLEQQYASGAPHRAITPDTLVMLANGEALLLPSIDETAATPPSLAGDLHALAQVVHYAITAELPPDGPLGPRLYDNYSEQLTKGLDSCLGPNRRLRPGTVDEMRTLLGIEAGAAELAPASGVEASAPAIGVADAAAAEPVQPGPADEVRTSDAELFTTSATQQMAPPVAFVEPPSALDAAPIIPDEPVITPRAGGATPPGPDFAAPALAPLPVPNPVPEPAVTPVQDAASVLSMQDAPAPGPLPATPEPVGLRESAPGAMLRKPAGQGGAAGESHPARGTPVPANLGDSAGPLPAAPRKQSAAPAAGTPEAPYGSAPQAWATTDRSSRAQRWGMLAGAAIVVLAAGSALVSYLQQNDTRDLVPLSLPAAERSASGLDTGETVVAPPPATTPADPGADPATTSVAGPGNASDVAAGAAADPAAGGTPAPAAAAGQAGEAVVNGTTYKLVIKPWGTVYVDGVDRGVSPPIKRLTLAPGQHTIRIANPNFPEQIMTVDAGAKETMIIEHDFTAKAE